MIVCYLDELKEGFFPYVQEVRGQGQGWWVPQKRVIGDNTQGWDAKDVSRWGPKPCPVGKCSALNAGICCALVTHLHCQQVTHLMVPLLKFYFHEEVRRAATSALPQLLRATQAAAEKGVQGASQVRACVSSGMWETLVLVESSPPPP